MTNAGLGWKVKTGGKEGEGEKEFLYSEERNHWNCECELSF